MFGGRQVQVPWFISLVAAFLLAGAAAFLTTGASAAAPSLEMQMAALAPATPGAQADSCGAPTPAPATAGVPGGRGAAPATAGAGDGRGGQPVFPAGQYPVQLPKMSLLGAPNEGPNPYAAGVHWGALPDGRKWGSTAGVSAAPDGTIWAIDRCGASGAGGGTCADSQLDPILQFDTNGKFLKGFGKGLIVSPHKITVDRDGFIWIADNGRSAGPPAKGMQVFKFSPDGKLLLTLGKAGVAGPGNDEFDAPTEAAVAPNGDIFVSDGHSGGGAATGNARIVKFDKTGKFIKTWGKKGMGPGEFDVIHTLAFDSRGRLFVGDRQNNRIQIFDQDGKYLDQTFAFGRPSGIYIDRNDVMYVADSESRDGRTNTGQNALGATGYGFNLGARRAIRVGSARDLKVTAVIPDPCPYPYPAVSSLAEGITADKDGNIYGADYLMTIRKFVKKK